MRERGGELIFTFMQIEKASTTVFTPLADGTGVLLNLDTRFYYSLNRTGAAIWQQIEEGATVNFDDLIRVTCERFDIDEEGARRNLNAFVEHLKEFKMIRVA